MDKGKHKNCPYCRSTITNEYIFHQARLWGITNGLCVYTEINVYNLCFLTNPNIIYHSLKKKIKSTFCPYFPKWYVKKKHMLLQN